jgi:hypothetical protein
MDPGREEHRRVAGELLQLREEDSVELRVRLTRRIASKLPLPTRQTRRLVVALSLGEDAVLAVTAPELRIEVADAGAVEDELREDRLTAGLALEDDALDRVADHIVLVPQHEQPLDFGQLLYHQSISLLSCCGSKLGSASGSSCRRSASCRQHEAPAVHEIGGRIPASSMRGADVGVVAFCPTVEPLLLQTAMIDTDAVQRRDHST